MYRGFLFYKLLRQNSYWWWTFHNQFYLVLFYILNQWWLVNTFLLFSYLWVHKSRLTQPIFLKLRCLYQTRRVCLGYRFCLFLRFIYWILEMLRQCRIFFIPYRLINCYVKTHIDGELFITSYIWYYFTHWTSDDWSIHFCY
jgi:hypothetical protein